MSAVKIRIATFAVLLVLAFLGGRAIAAEATTVAHTEVSCTSSSGAALATNSARQSALFINDGTAVIWLRIGETAVANEGIRLNANGGSYTIADVYGNRDTEAINCITASATVVLLVVEWSNP